MWVAVEVGRLTIAFYAQEGSQIGGAAEPGPDESDATGSCRGPSQCPRPFPNTLLHIPVSLQGGKGLLLCLSQTGFAHRAITAIQKDLLDLVPKEGNWEGKEVASFRVQRSTGD